jgi:hypothetical protein
VYQVRRIFSFILKEVYDAEHTIDYAQRQRERERERRRERERERERDRARERETERERGTIDYPHTHL